MKDHIAFLPTETYTFWGYSINIESNSIEILEYLRSIYGRFNNKNYSSTAKCSKKSPKASPHSLQFIDNITDSGELIIQSKQESRALKCKNLYSFDYDYYTSKGTVPSPLAYVQWFVLNNACILAKDYQLIHSGAVSMNGEGIILPAVSGMGKTTLTIKLVQSGCKFLSDELAALKPEQELVEPFFRKINLSDHSLSLLGLPSYSEKNTHYERLSDSEWMLDIEDIVPDSLSESCPLRYIIFLQGFGEKPRLQKISSSNAIFKLFKYSLKIEEEPATLLYTFAPLLNKVKCYNLIAGDVNETAELILNLVEDRHLINS